MFAGVNPLAFVITIISVIAVIALIAFTVYRRRLKMRTTAVVVAEEACFLAQDARITAEAERDAAEAQNVLLRQRLTAEQEAMLKRETQEAEVDDLQYYRVDPSHVKLELRIGEVGGAGVRFLPVLSLLD